ncbi:MAG: 30S ribosomal protein S7 [Candidatus Diapherotrites archaeon]|nr:30S ribosomal protein S7 [Candidatus Diapherotrites archaeon]
MSTQTQSAEVKLFDKYETSNITITDISLANHMLLYAKKFPHTFGKMSQRRFGKEKLSIVERLINKIMRSGQGKRVLSGKYIRGRGGCGKKLQCIKIVERAFDVISKETKENPLQILVRAVENSAPREDVTQLQKGGISYSQAVDVAPMKRVDEALKNIAIAAFSQSFNSKTLAQEALAKEIILASKEDPASFSVKRRNEVERIAASSR